MGGGGSLNSDIYRHFCTGGNASLHPVKRVRVQVCDNSSVNRDSGSRINRGQTSAGNGHIDSFGTIAPRILKYAGHLDPQRTSFLCGGRAGFCSWQKSSLEYVRSQNQSIVLCLDGRFEQREAESLLGLSIRALRRHEDNRQRSGTNSDPRSRSCSHGVVFSLRNLNLLGA